MDELKYIDEQQAQWTIRPNESIMQAEGLRTKRPN